MGQASSAVEASSLGGFLWLYLDDDALVAARPGRRRRVVWEEEEDDAKADEEESGGGPCLAWFQTDPASHRLHWRTVLDDTSAAPDASFPASGGSFALTALSRVTARGPSPDTPFVFVVEGGGGGGPRWRLCLQAPSSTELAAWLGVLRRYTMAIAPAMPAHVSAAFQAATANDKRRLRDVMCGEGNDGALVVASRGVDLGVARNAAGDTLLMAACRVGAAHVVRWLLRHGLAPGAADAVQAVNLDGETALHAAAACPVPSVLGLVLEVCLPSRDRVTWLNYPALGGMTALHTAAACRRQGAMEVLLAAGCNAFSMDGAGWTAAHHLVAGSPATPTVVAPPADVGDECVRGCAQVLTAMVPEVLDVLDGAGNSAVHLAAKHGRLECVQEFLKCAIDLRITNDDGCTPASVAAAFGHLACVGALKEYGDAVDPRRALAVSAMRRLAGQHAAQWAAQGTQARLDRVISVWEAVLSRAVARAGDRAPVRAKAAATHKPGNTWDLCVEDGSGAAFFSSLATGEAVWCGAGADAVSDAASRGTWTRATDPASGWPYFTSNATGEAVWEAGDAGGGGGGDDPSPPAAEWVPQYDDAHGAWYEVNSVSGETRWQDAVAAAGAGHGTASGTFWRLEFDGGMPYFVHGDGASMWASCDPGPPPPCPDGINEWQLVTEPSGGGQYFCNRFNGAWCWAEAF